MIKGAFATFVHDHYFSQVSADITQMRDLVVFRSPFGPVGRLIDWIIMTRHLRKLIEARQVTIKCVAEGGAADDA
jgi:hypothetical protein